MTTDTLPSQMTRPQLVAYLQEAGAYAGHSRDSKDQLVAAAQAVRYADQPEPTGKPTAAQATAHTTAKAAKEAQLLAAAEVAASDDPTERLALAKAEHTMLKAWVNDGSRPPRPATPNLDAVNADYEARGGKPRTTKRTTSSGAPKVEQARPKVGAGIAVLELRNAGHGATIAKALADAVDNGDEFVDGKFLLVPKANAQEVLTGIVHALDAKGLGQFAKRQLVLASLLVRQAYPKVADPRTNPVAKLVDVLIATGKPWSVGWAADSTPTFEVGGVTYATAKAAAEAVAA